jgi:transcriptional regulator with XRE-family HTH domain
VIRTLIEQQPSGANRTLDYWIGFSAIDSYENAIVPLELCGSGGDSMASHLLAAADASTTLGHDEIIAAIRSSLSLQMKELAEVLGVQRPTIYSWIKNEAEPTSKNRRRLNQIYRIAQFWNEQSNLPLGKLLRSVNGDGVSVLDTLGNDELNETEIQSQLFKLAGARQAIKENSNKRHPSVNEIAARHNLNLDHVSSQQHIIDVETGKRSHFD